MSNERPIELFEGKLKCSPANRNELQKLVAKFEERHPPPTPPKIQVKTFEAVVSGAGYELRDDPDDEDYKRKLRKHHALLYVLRETFFIKTCIHLDSNEAIDELTAILIDQGRRERLYEFIISISWVTQAGIDKAVRELSYTWFGKPISEISTPGSPASMSLDDLVYRAGANYGLPHWEVDKLNIRDRTLLAARFIADGKMKYLEEKHRYDEARAKAKARSGKGRK